MKKPITIFWFRRDLRLDDNHGLYQALKSGNDVLPLFIFDTDILTDLLKDDHRVSFIHHQLERMNTALNNQGCSLLIQQGSVHDVFVQLLNKYDVQKVIVNEDYEPQAIKRDKEIQKFLSDKDIVFESYKDQVIFHKDEVVKGDGTAYRVYTPYKNQWKQTLVNEKDFKAYNSESYLDNCIKDTSLQWLSLKDIGFTKSNIIAPEYTLDSDLIEHYANKRDIPREDGTSHLSTYLRFGVVSIRACAKQAYTAKDHTFLHELIWREFFMAILWHYPYTVTQSFYEQYDYIQWENNEKDFRAWKEGKTGYPIVDAGIRELNTTGYMHNRVRMIVASFLCKHLLIDWRWGERYFAEKLFDFELSSNVGNWQWVAGTGVDAAPYFRIFNPHTQLTKFDKNLEYTKKWVPEYETDKYPQEIVDHKEARERCLERYKEAREGYKQG